MLKCIELWTITFFPEKRKLNKYFPSGSLGKINIILMIPFENTEKFHSRHSTTISPNSPEIFSKGKK